MVSLLLPGAFGGPGGSHPCPRLFPWCGPWCPDALLPHHSVTLLQRLPRRPRPCLGSLCDPYAAQADCPPPPGAVVYLPQPCLSRQVFPQAPGCARKASWSGVGVIGLGSHRGVVGTMLPWWGFLCLVSEALGSGGRHPSSWCSLWGSCWPSLGLSSSSACHVSCALRG